MEKIQYKVYAIINTWRHGNTETGWNGEFDTIEQAAREWEDAKRMAPLHAWRLKKITTVTTEENIPTEQIRKILYPNEDFSKPI